MAISKKIYLLGKILVIVLCILFIGYKLWNEAQSNSLFEAFYYIQKNKIWIVVLVSLMTIPNWGIEAIKWKFIIKKLQAISFTSAFKAVLAGITVSIFTPNRVGEFGGRILALDRKNRVAGVFATLLGGYAQFLITLIIGIISLPLYLHKFPSQLPLNIEFPIIFPICIVVIFALLFVYLKIKFFAKFLELLIKNVKKKRFVSFLKDYTPVELLKILIFSLLRFFIFTCQFYLLLNFFGVSLSFFQGLVSISLIYFIMTIIPVISLFEFGIRGSVAILILGVYTPFSLGIISASILLWIINLALPALVGSFLLYRYKI